MVVACLFCLVSISGDRTRCRAGEDNIPVPPIGLRGNSEVPLCMFLKDLLLNRMHKNIDIDIDITHPAEC